MHKFDSAGGRLELVFRQAHGARGGEQQGRPDALAAAQYAVAHGLVQAGRHQGGLRKPRGQRAFHTQAPRLELRTETFSVRGLVRCQDAEIGSVAHALGPPPDSRLMCSPGSRA